MPDRLTIDTIDEELAPGARNALRVCLQLKPHERITIITDESTVDVAAALQTEVDTRSLLNELLEFVSTEVNELGSQREMAHIERIMREGTGADRQLAAFARTQDMKAVVDQIVTETYEGLRVNGATT